MTGAHTDQRGMTLVEVTITLVLTLVVSSAVIMFMINGIRTYGMANAKANLLGQAQTAVQRISDDIMLSATADQNNRIDDDNSPVAGDPNGWSSDADTLILASAVEDTSRNIVYADPSKYISYKNNVIYYLDGSTLYRRVLAAPVVANRAKTTCPPNLASSSCPGDTRMLDDVKSFTVSYRDHQNQVVTPDEARSVEVTVVLQSTAYEQANITYTMRTVFRND